MRRSVQRFDHDHGVFLDCDLGREVLPIHGVGIEWDAYVLRSSLLSTSNVEQLRVKSLDPRGPAQASARVSVDDRLVSIDGEAVMGQDSALQISKVSSSVDFPSSFACRHVCGVRVRETAYGHRLASRWTTASPSFRKTHSRRRFPFRLPCC